MRTREEKVQRLMELSDYFKDEWAGRFRAEFMEDWLRCAERSDNEHHFISRNTEPDDVKGRNKHVRLVWDVHTEKAFTPLYRLL